jgi:hypothetical protein
MSGREIFFFSKYFFPPKKREEMETGREEIDG